MQSESIFPLMLPYIRNKTFLFEGSQASPVCPCDRMKMGMEL